MATKSKEEWAFIFEQFEGSQVSQRQFCREQGINIAGFSKQFQKRQKGKSGLTQNRGPVFVNVNQPPESLSIRGDNSFSEDAVELTIGPINLKIYQTSNPAALRLALQAMVEICGRT